jgi:hypothetical protein
MSHSALCRRSIELLTTQHFDPGNFLMVYRACAWPFASLAIVAIAQCSAADGPAPVVKVHEGTHWIWYAPKDLQEKHGKEFMRFYGYADKAFDHLVECWGLKPGDVPFTLYIDPKKGGGFATGDIGEVHKVTAHHA